MKNRIISFIFFAQLLLQLNVQAQPVLNSNDYVKALKNVTDVMVNDVTSPVAASRYYAYITLASYETNTYFNHSAYPTLLGTLNHFQIDQSKPLVDSFNTSLATILSIYLAGEKFLPSGISLQSKIDSISKFYYKKDSNYLKRSIQHAQGIVDQIVIYSKKDGFTRLSGMKRYTPKIGLGYWKPTPPVFMAPVEPNWSTLRTFLIDTSNQFKTQNPAPYDIAPSSKFYALTKQVYDYKKNATKEQVSIALFWDCNPFAVEQIGHVEFGIKKISPGGHWLGIAGIACNKKALSLTKTALAHALLSVTLADAFIACWQEKFTSDRIRPVTAIHQFLDPKWQPILQTPPFPEYVSGHSVASTAASVVLTQLFGDQFYYIDNTEVEFGLPIRKFKSFKEAAAEASLSRLYGGIHFKDAIDQGVWLGNQIGLLASQKLTKHLFAFK